MKIFLLSFAIVSLLFLFLDFIWLSMTIKSFYRPNLSEIPMNEKPVVWAASAFYLLYVIGLTLIIVLPAIHNDSLVQALLNGIIFGLVAYGTYNLTNMAFIRDWSTSVVLVDMIWGGILTGTVSFLTTYIIKNFLN